MRRALVLYALIAACAPLSSLPPAPARREVSFNGRALDAEGYATLGRIEERYGSRIPDGRYWYDPTSGAAGLWGGPQIALLPPGLDLGGRLPRNASGGGDGRLTGVFVNGRELHPVDVQVLTSLLGMVVAGRWRVDEEGNAGPEYGPPLFNLRVRAEQRPSAAMWRSDRPADALFATR